MDVSVPTRVPLGEYVPAADARLVMRLTWTGYEALLALRGENPRPRISYLDGAVELMTTSFAHEKIKGRIGRMLDAFCFVRNIRFEPGGNYTIADRDVEAAAEADECYMFGGEEKARPDLAIEVVWTSGGIDKLEVYRRLGVAEAWFWENGKITVYVLGPSGYEVRDRSMHLEQIDLGLICELVEVESMNDAIARMHAFAKSLG